MIDKSRVVCQWKGNQPKERMGMVVYWMHRDQRAKDNYALLHAQNIAVNNNMPLAVLFNLDRLNLTERKCGFILNGLEDLSNELKRVNIPFFFSECSDVQTFITLLKEMTCTYLVGDFLPLKYKDQWDKSIGEAFAQENKTFEIVDAHNIIPCTLLSDKQEYSAYTIRRKVNRLLPVFLSEIPEMKKQEGVFYREILNKARPEKLKIFDKDLSVTQEGDREIISLSGSKYANEKLQTFLHKGIEIYNEKRNDPVAKAQSGLSPYINTGQIAAQRIALEVQKINGYQESVDAFLEELIVRRELADNFCYYNKNYDRFEGFHNWAQETLNAHREDVRSHLYTFQDFENATTHDRLWNAAQISLLEDGQMHGYMRMYWAKKILEWSETPETAMETAISLNDTYALDGCDPNGYTGIAWSIGGVHDRAWKTRPVYGKIRYMNDNGCKRKFDVQAYIKEYMKRI